MRAKDLVVNGEYLSCSSKDWKTNTYRDIGYGGTLRVRVLSGPAVYEWSERSGYSEVRSTSYRTKSGMLVWVLDDAGEHVRNDVVTLASIRGPWESTWASVQQTAARHRAQRQADREANAAARARILAALGRIEAVTGMSGMYVLDNERAVIYFATLEAIADRLESGK